MTPPKRVYCCARCGRQFKVGEERLHSEWSGNSYCIDIDACAPRARRFTGRAPLVWRPQSISVKPRRRAAAAR